MSQRSDEGADSTMMKPSAAAPTTVGGSMESVDGGAEEADEVYILDALRVELLAEQDAPSTDPQAENRGGLGDLPYPAVLRSMPESDVVDEAVVAEVDHLLSHTRPLSDSQLQCLLAGADFGVQLASNRNPDHAAIARDFESALSGAEVGRVDNPTRDAFESLVRQLRDDQPVSFEDFEVDVVATWVREFEVPWAQLLGVLAPDAGTETGEPHALRDRQLAFRSAGSEWTDYADAVLRLVNADEKLAGASELGQLSVDQRHEEHREDEDQG